MIWQEQLNNTFGLKIRGQTSQDGSAETNKRLRLARASSVLQSLALTGLTNSHVEAVSQDIDDSRDTRIDSVSARRVMFKVISIRNDQEDKGKLR